jgi:hypothetical protein
MKRGPTGAGGELLKKGLDPLPTFRISRFSPWTKTNKGQRGLTPFSAVSRESVYGPSRFDRVGAMSGR